MPGEADIAAVFGEPGKLDAGHVIAKSGFSHHGEDGGGDSGANELRRLREIRAQMRGREDFLFLRGSPTQFFEKLDALRDRQLRDWWAFFVQAMGS